MSPEARIEALRQATPGGWVAFSEDESRVLCYAGSYEEAVAEAEKQGVSEPVLVKVPIDWTARVMAL